MIQDNEHCKNCKFFRKLKHNFKTGEGFQESYCCIIWEYIDDCDVVNTWIQEVGPLSMCEMFTAKDGTNNKE